MIGRMHENKNVDMSAYWPQQLQFLDSDKEAEVVREASLRALYNNKIIGLKELQKYKNDRHVKVAERAQKFIDMITKGHENNR